MFNESEGMNKNKPKKRRTNSNIGIEEKNTPSTVPSSQVTTFMKQFQPALAKKPAVAQNTRAQPDKQVISAQIKQPVEKLTPIPPPNKPNDTLSRMSRPMEDSSINNIMEGQNEQTGFFSMSTQH